MTGLLSALDLRAPVGQRWYEDYVPGSVVEFGYVTLREAEMVAFAQNFDRQQIHTDPVWATTGPFQGLIASGLQTLAVCMSLYVDHYVSGVASLASPGLDELRWPTPVRPSDRLRVQISVAQARRSCTKPDRGLVHSQVKALNQDDKVVLSFTSMNFFAYRPGTSARADGSVAAGSRTVLDRRPAAAPVRR